MPHFKPDPRIYGQIVTDLRVSNGAHRLWSYLANRAGRNGHCWHSQRTICREIGCDWRSYAKWVSELKELGYLKMVKVLRGLHYYPFGDCKITVTPPVKLQSGRLLNHSQIACKNTVLINRKELRQVTKHGATPSGANGAPLSEAGKKAFADFQAMKSNL